MSSSHTFPPGNNDFNTYANAAISYVTDAGNATRLGVSADNVTLLTGLLDSWGKNWQSFTTPSLHTTIITKTKDSLRKQIITALQGVYEDIPKSALTIDDRNVLNLKERDTHGSRVPVMNNAPTLVIEDMQHLQHDLHFSNPATPDSDAVPYGQKIVLEYFTGDAGLQDAKIDFGNDKNVTRARCAVSFTNAQVTQTCYYRCCYENTHGERSAWSITVEAVVA